MTVSTVDFSGAAWRKSSRSNGASNANCVEVAVVGSAVGVRDSKSPGAGVLAFPAARWASFVRRMGS
ncbi:DUF397 domain-containing protein [Saccharothrix australiensis]|uniref:Uncharacterized protein DUF397 n=1 Tax=Saccharothrix australiensis TaxID=2072 RepID=A0A495VWA2_9PSEU|nr:DUF397 domain-containing protein [Saccharothrix australiensis]RKT51938.1 uncharacterized protein DUF397 [Saccharothrix australiensis]